MLDITIAQSKQLSSLSTQPVCHYA